MISGLQAMPWTVIFQESVAVGLLVNSARGFALVQPANQGLSFGCLITAYTGGSITPKIRLGFQQADAATSVRGVDLRLLGALNQSDWASVPLGVGAAAPNVPGAAMAIHPPYVQILFDSAAATTLTYVILASCFYAP